MGDLSKEGHPRVEAPAQHCFNRASGFKAPGRAEVPCWQYLLKGKITHSPTRYWLLVSASPVSPARRSMSQEPSPGKLKSPPDLSSILAAHAICAEGARPTDDTASTAVAAVCEYVHAVCTAAGISWRGLLQAVIGADSATLHIRLKVNAGFAAARREIVGYEEFVRDAEGDIVIAVTSLPRRVVTKPGGVVAFAGGVVADSGGMVARPRRVVTYARGMVTFTLWVPSHAAGTVASTRGVAACPSERPTAILEATRNFMEASSFGDGERSGTRWRTGVA